MRRHDLWLAIASPCTLVIPSRTPALAHANAALLRGCNSFGSCASAHRQGNPALSAASLHLQRACALHGMGRGAHSLFRARSPDYSEGAREPVAGRHRSQVTSCAELPQTGNHSTLLASWPGSSPCPTRRHHAASLTLHSTLDSPEWLGAGALQRVRAGLGERGYYI